MPRSIERSWNPDLRISPLVLVGSETTSASNLIPDLIKWFLASSILKSEYFDFNSDNILLITSAVLPPASIASAAVSMAVFHTPIGNPKALRVFFVLILAFLTLLAKVVTVRSCSSWKPLV